jgi:hypothetical protein
MMAASIPKLVLVCLILLILCSRGELINKPFKTDSQITIDKIMSILKDKIIDE